MNQAQTNEQEKKLAKMDSYKVMGLKDVSNIQKALINNSGGKGLAASDLPRITFPTGGATTWTITDNLTATETTMDELTVIPIHWKVTRTLWPAEFSRTAQALCHSDEGQRGIGEPGVICEHCEHNEFGSKGRGKACREGRDVFILFPDSILPSVLQIPPGSINPFNDFLMNLAIEGISYFEAVVSFKLVAEKNRDGIKYSKLHPMLVQRLPDVQADAVRKFRDGFIGALSNSGIMKNEAPEDISF